MANLTRLFTTTSACNQSSWNIGAPKSHIFRTVGGETAQVGQFPYQVFIHYEGTHNCCDSIIGSHFILTLLIVFMVNFLSTWVYSLDQIRIMRELDIRYAPLNIKVSTMPLQLRMISVYMMLVDAISYNANTQPIVFETEELGDNLDSVVSR
ncbi:hypothetical protein FQA39_LY15722 [Lamprigera yunnana]|nr:hypothetical protein FQA39_LY15722 [Lamprigera yunnana]